MNRSIKSAFLSVFQSKVLIKVIGAFTAPILTRLLGAQRYGIYATLLSIFAISQILFTAGINTGIKKFLAENRSLADWENQVFGFFFRVSLLFTVAGGALFALAAGSGIVERALGVGYTLYFYLLGIYLVTHQASEYNLRSLMGLQKEFYSEPLRVVRKGVFSISAVALVFVGFSVGGVLSAHILASTTCFLLGLYFLRADLDLSSIFRKVSAGVPRRELLTFNFATIAFVFFLTTFYHVDVLTLRVFRPEAEVGYYKAALVIAGFLWLAPSAVQDVMVQSVSEYWRKDAVDQINRISNMTTRYAFLFTSLLAIGIAALADPFIPLYFGSEFRPSIRPFVILLPGTVGFAIARPMFAITQAKGQMRPLVIITGVLASVNLVLNVALVPFYGTTGAAVATTIGYGLLPLGNIACARYVGYRPFVGSGFFRILLTCFISAPLIFLFAHLTPGLFALVVVPPLGAAVFTIAAIATGALPKDDLGMFRTMIEGSLNRG